MRKRRLQWQPLVFRAHGIDTFNGYFYSGKSIFCRKNIVVAVYTVRMRVFVISCVVVLVCLNLFVDVILNAYDLV